uniref:Uncharacterized protein n=1 Tax=Arundo donax TaxID=35708 RepID=A0A0A9BC57_ARUDO
MWRMIHPPHLRRAEATAWRALASAKQALILSPNFSQSCLTAHKNR